MVRVFIVLSILSYSVLLKANSCCGQGTSDFVILYQKHSWSFQTRYSLINNIGRTNSEGKIDLWNNNKQRVVNSLGISTAVSLNEKLQISASNQFSSSTLQWQGTRAQQQSHFSDTLMALNYEIVPEVSFSYWKPNIYLSLLANLPTGVSSFDENTGDESHGVTGHNQWGLGLGLSLKKVYFPIEITNQFKVVNLFQKKFKNVTVKDFLDISNQIRLSYYPKDIKFVPSLGLTWKYLTSKNLLSQLSNTKTSATEQLALSVSILRPISESLSFSVSYSSQSILKYSRNTLVGNTISAAISYLNE